MNKRKLSERVTCTKFITPALVAAGWDAQLHVREELSFTKGRGIVRGKMTTRGESKRADYQDWPPRIGSRLYADGRKCRLKSIALWRTRTTWRVDLFTRKR
ncbi:MAG: hypothetical protein SH850_14840, partial [Planctomycetaceae bacterium]|nr:hypothetical protein [Planctomycetaceae bacterium]